MPFWFIIRLNDICRKKEVGICQGLQSAERSAIFRERFLLYPENPLKIQRLCLILTVNEYETIRLIDREGFSQGRMWRVHAGDPYHSPANLYLCEKKDCNSYCRRTSYTDRRRKLSALRRTGQLLSVWRPRSGALKEVEEEAMKIIIPVDEQKDVICPTFCQSRYFAVHDTETGRTEVSGQPGKPRQRAGLVSRQAIVCFWTVMGRR